MKKVHGSRFKVKDVIPGSALQGTKAGIQKKGM